MYKLFWISPTMSCCEKELIVFVFRRLTAPDIRDMQKTVILSHCLSPSEQRTGDTRPPLYLWIVSWTPECWLGLLSRVMLSKESGWWPVRWQVRWPVRWPVSSEWFKYGKSPGFDKCSQTSHRTLIIMSNISVVTLSSLSNIILLQEIIIKACCCQLWNSCSLHGKVPRLDGRNNPNVVVKILIWQYSGPGSRVVCYAGV